VEQGFRRQRKENRKGREWSNATSDRESRSGGGLVRDLLSKLGRVMEVRDFVQL